MEVDELYLLSTYLKKWSYQENKISVYFSYFTGSGYDRGSVDMRINSPQAMVHDFLNGAFNKIKEKVNLSKKEDGHISTKLVNESEVKQKLLTYFTKILKEFNTNKRSRGRARMISNRSMDFYYNDYEYEPLSDDAKFFVHLNRGLNKMNGDLWSAAIEDLQKALEFNPEDPSVNKYMGQALMKSQKKEDALEYFKKYAEMDNSIDSLNELARAFIKLEDFKEAKNIYKKMQKLDPNDLVAKAGEAQVAYMEGKPFLTKLDKIKKLDEVWLRDYLKNTWHYKLPGYGKDESKMWNAATASRYLGYERPFDLTKKAFNNEIPCYFDPERGTIRFVKSELDFWVELHNRFNLDGAKYEIYPDRLNDKEIEIGNLKAKAATASKTRNKNSVSEDIS